MIIVVCCCASEKNSVDQPIYVLPSVVIHPPIQCSERNNFYNNRERGTQAVHLFVHAYLYTLEHVPVCMSI
jgi:hypothetical protein